MSRRADVVSGIAKCPGLATPEELSSGVGPAPIPEGIWYRSDVSIGRIKDSSNE